MSLQKNDKFCGIKFKVLWDLLLYLRWQCDIKTVFFFVIDSLLSILVSSSYKMAQRDLFDSHRKKRFYGKNNFTLKIILSFTIQNRAILKSCIIMKEKFHSNFSSKDYIKDWVPVKKQTYLLEFKSNSWKRKRYVIYESLYAVLHALMNF